MPENANSPQRTRSDAGKRPRSARSAQAQGRNFAAVISFPSPVSRLSDPLSQERFFRIRELQKYIAKKRLEFDASIKEEQREFDELKRETLRALESGAQQEPGPCQAEIVERVKIATKAHRFKKIIKHLVIK